MRRFFHLLGSLKIAVPLLLTLAAVLAWGTIYETRFGTAAVQRFIYHSVWFQGLLGFLALNLALAALSRRPWKRRHLPFLLAHLGIIAILTGGVLGGRLAIEGQLLIPEGTSSHVLRTPQKVLVVHQPNPGLTRIFPVHFESAAWVLEPRQSFRIPSVEGGGPLELTVDRYYADAAGEEQVRPDGRSKNPAVLLRLEQEGQSREVWLFSRDLDRFGAQWGQLHALFLEVRDPRELRRLPTQRLPPASLLLIRTQSDGRLFGVLTGAQKQVQRMGPLEVGKSYAHPWLPLRFSVAESVLNARREQSFSPLGMEVRKEALRVLGHQNGQVQQAWLRLAEPVTLPLGAHPVVVEYRHGQRELPFSVKLVDFRKIDYPGTETAAGFESDVELSDPKRGVHWARKISMNNPLKYRGFTLFQSSYLRGPVETTVLSVRNDPGTPFVYAGFLIVIAGIVTLFTSRGKQ